MRLNEALFESVEDEVSKHKNLDESVGDPGVAFSAYITNLGKYNEGELVGKWVDFPIDEDDFEEVLKEIGISDEPDTDGNIYEEWFVTDYDSDRYDMYPHLGEYPGYDKLNELAEALADLDEDELEVVEAIVEAKGYSLIDAIDEKDNVQYVHGITSDEDLGYWYVDEVLNGDLSGENIDRYFDYDQLGRDLSLETWEDDEGNDISAGEYWCGDDNASDEEIGLAYVDQVGIDGVNNKEYFFDYEAFGRDLAYDGTFTENGFLFD